MTQEHFEWCRDRAFASLDLGEDYTDVFDAYVTDMESFDGSSTHPSINMGLDFIGNGMISNATELKKFLNSPFYL